MWYKFAINNEYIDKALKRFDTTDDPEKAAYVLPEGQLLNFYDRFQGDRFLHGQIFEVMPPVQNLDNEIPNDSRDYVIPFLKETNSIRVSRIDNEWRVEIWKAPTLDQINSIKDHHINGLDFHYEIPPFKNSGVLNNARSSTVGSFLSKVRANFLAMEKRDK
jgi:hypothetical protein